MLAARFRALLGDDGQPVVCPLDCTRAATHAILYCVESTPPTALVLFRHDGALGYPGGMVDPGETVRQAVIREIQEEIHFTLTPEQEAQLTYQGVDVVYATKKKNNAAQTTENKSLTPTESNKESGQPQTTGEPPTENPQTSGNIALHLYTLALPLPVLQQIMVDLPASRDFMVEIFGSALVPLHFKEGSRKGLPQFLHNCVAANGKEQLIHTLLTENIFTPQQMKHILDAANLVITEDLVLESRSSPVQ
eukprot:TRINITY_DN67320_c1_g2_i1.p1 TRINITY_DN67320_c1_g2~~TRINITY_DN67320_c1_g2_i1.p1  ORF type:complete len:250 (+),score=33.03 TRINITY_DN67320_c1_g2_i1:31-780(+)